MNESLVWQALNLGRARFLRYLHAKLRGFGFNDDSARRLVVITSREYAPREISH